MFGGDLQRQFKRYLSRELIYYKRGTSRAELLIAFAIVVVGAIIIKLIVIMR